MRPSEQARLESLSPNRPVTFLFWNLGRKDLTGAVVAAVAEYGVDILILAEAEGLSVKGCLFTLNRDAGHKYFCPASGSKRLTVLTKFDSAFMQHVATGEPASTARWTFHRLHLPHCHAVIVASVHLRSKVRAGEADQYKRARRLSEEILRLEAIERSTRTLVVGDFNMDPFEPGMQACDGLHALLSRVEISQRRGSRRDDATDYRMFFNPGWRLHGEQVSGPPGSYYYAGDGTVVQYWHLFDQVLIRPALLDGFSNSAIRILDSIAGEPLLDSAGRPDTARFSDHLPLLFRLEI